MRGRRTRPAADYTAGARPTSKVSSPACLAAVPALMARPLKRPICLFITYDDETDMSGPRRLIADIADGGRKPEWCIVGEPSLTQPILAHRDRLRCT